MEYFSDRFFDPNKKQENDGDVKVDIPNGYFDEETTDDQEELNRIKIS